MNARQTKLAFAVLLLVASYLSDRICAQQMNPSATPEQEKSGAFRLTCGAPADAGSHRLATKTTKVALPEVILQALSPKS